MRDVKFDLHPWEMAHSKRICEGEVAFEAKMGDEICQFRRAQYGMTVSYYFRFSEAPDDHFVPAHFRRNESTFLFLPGYYIDANFSDDDISRRRDWEQAIELNAWGRFFVFDGDFNFIRDTSEIPTARWSVILLANGQGQFENFYAEKEALSERKSWHSRAPFVWSETPSPEILRARTAESWLKWLHEELEDASSSIRFARDLTEQSPDEANSRRTLWKHGSLSEWKEVSRWIMQTENSLWSDNFENELVDWAWDIQEGSEVMGWERGKLSGPRIQNVPLASNVIIQRLRIASHYFAPFFDEEAMSQHFCFAYWRNIFKDLHITSRAPSAHESLEAALNLRDWAQGKFSAEEMAVLCNF